MSNEEVYIEIRSSTSWHEFVSAIIPFVNRIVKTGNGSKFFSQYDAERCELAAKIIRYTLNA